MPRCRTLANHHAVMRLAGGRQAAGRLAVVGAESRHRDVSLSVECLGYGIVMGPGRDLARLDWSRRVLWVM